MNGGAMVFRTVMADGSEKGNIGTKNSEIRTGNKSRKATGCENSNYTPTIKLHIKR